jgi:hypothetical protein
MSTYELGLQAQLHDLLPMVEFIERQRLGRFKPHTCQKGKKKALTTKYIIYYILYYIILINY